MHRPKRRRVARCFDYNNGMLHEEEIALRRALHASLASKTTDEDDMKTTFKPATENSQSDEKSLSNSKERQTKSNSEPITARGLPNKILSKRRPDESGETVSKRRPKKLLVRKKSKEKPGNSRMSNDLVKRGIKSKCSNDEKHVTDNQMEGMFKKQRRRKNNGDATKDDGDIKSSESFAKVHVQRKFAQINPASPRSLLLFQSQMQPMTTRAKTEDFLDFLCLRGSTSMPKSLEMFNNPCAPVSPLSDEDEGNIPTRITDLVNGKDNNEPIGKQGIIMQNSESSSSSNSLVSSPVSTRIQSYNALPEFTNTHSILTNIPTPIPYPTPPTPAKQLGFNIYGALSSNQTTPSLVPHNPRVSAVVMGTHISPEKQGFLPVKQSGLDSNGRFVSSTLPKQSSSTIPSGSTGDELKNNQVTKPNNRPSKEQDNAGKTHSGDPVKGWTNDGNECQEDSPLIEHVNQTKRESNTAAEHVECDQARNQHDNPNKDDAMSKPKGSSNKTVVDSTEKGCSNVFVKHKLQNQRREKLQEDLKSGMDVPSMYKVKGKYKIRNKNAGMLKEDAKMSMDTPNKGKYKIRSSSLVNLEYGKGTKDNPDKKVAKKKASSSNEAENSISFDLERKNPTKSVYSEVKHGSSKVFLNSEVQNGIRRASRKSSTESCDFNNKKREKLNSVPVFTPSESEFKNPLKYVELIKNKAEPFGLCLIVPPKSWKPEYCLSDEIRFTTKLQRVHCLGKKYPTVEHELTAIRKHLEQQNILLPAMPQISGCEVDLPFMSKVVEEFGGLQQIINKRKWVKVADRLCIPKTAVDRVTKLEHIYCKYLLSYDMLSKEEKTTLRDNAIRECNKKSSQQYIAKGRSMSLALFQRNAKNIYEYYMKDANSTNVEEVFWHVVDDGERYVVVHAAEMEGTAFPTSKIKPFYKSKWNLNVLPKSPGSMARDLPDVAGITSPVVKVEMVLSAETWNSPPHDLFTVDYLHQGETKIWYSVPSSDKEKLFEVMKQQLNGEIGDMTNHLIPHSSLSESGISVHRVIQEPGQYVVKFPGAYHSSLSTGFAVSEFVSFASMVYLPGIKTTFQDDLTSEVDHMFSWESLVVSSVKEELRRSSSEDALNVLIPELKELRNAEASMKDVLATYGVVEQLDGGNFPDKKPRGRRTGLEEIERCHGCSRFCFPSAVMDSTGALFCLHHGIEKMRKEKNIEVTLASHISLSALNALVREADEKLEEVRRKSGKVKRLQPAVVSIVVEEGNKDGE